MHDLDRHPALERLVAGQEDRRHSAAAELRLEPVAARENGPDQAARQPGCRSLGHPVSIFDTHPEPAPAGWLPARPCPSRSATTQTPPAPGPGRPEPKLRRVMREFGDQLRFVWVMGGLAREHGPDYRDEEGGIGSGSDCFADLMAHWIDVDARTGMPIDARLWTENPIRSTYPACQAVKAAAEQGSAAAYRYGSFPSARSHAPTRSLEARPWRASRTRTGDRGRTRSPAGSPVPPRPPRSGRRAAAPCRSRPRRRRR